MDRKLITIIVLFIIVSLSSCTRSWRVYYKESALKRIVSDNESKVNMPDKYIGKVDYATTTEKVLCYTTFMFYGGYCWYIRLGNPSSNDYESAKKEAVIMFPEKNLKMNEIYVEPK